MTEPQSWIHPEPVSGDASLQTGLQAAAADPLWLLARQIGIGELTGFDGGSPVVARMDASTSQFTRLRAAETGSSPGVPLSPGGAPVEALIEAEAEPAPRALPSNPNGPPGTALSRPITAAQYGLHYLRLLAAAGLTDLATYRAQLAASYPVPAAAGLSGPPAPTADAPVLRLFAGRVPDGQALYADLAGLRANPPTVAPAHPLPAGGVPAILAAGLGWLDWYDQVAGCPAGGPTAAEPTWQPDRLEYQACLAAPGPGTETILTAAEHTAGPLDWYQFDIAASSRHAAPT